MSRYVGPSCRLCRRETTKLFLKGTKCLTEKCPVERRAYPPGQHGQTGGRPRKASEYAKQMREKQKVKRIYGLTERQFRNTFDAVTREPGVKGTNLLIALESRLDNVVHRMGFASSRKAARQLISHGHIEVNGHRVDIPAYRVAPGEEVRVAPSSRECVPSSWPRKPPRAGSRWRGSPSTRTRPPAAWSSVPRARPSRSTPRNSSSSSSTRSDHDH